MEALGGRGGIAPTDTILTELPRLRISTAKGNKNRMFSKGLPGAVSWLLGPTELFLVRMGKTVGPPCLTLAEMRCTISDFSIISFRPKVRIKIFKILAHLFPEFCNHEIKLHKCLIWYISMWQGVIRDSTSVKWLATNSTTRVLFLARLATTVFSPAFGTNCLLSAGCREVKRPQCEAPSREVNNVIQFVTNWRLSPDLADCATQRPNDVALATFAPPPPRICDSRQFWWKHNGRHCWRKWTFYALYLCKSHWTGIYIRADC
jgi:hypothetical protein